jgi:hypothetical protein
MHSVPCDVGILREAHRILESNGMNPPNGGPMPINCTPCWKKVGFGSLKKYCQILLVYLLEVRKIE